MKKQKKTKNGCIFCGKKTNYYTPELGYVCAKCLGEYKGAYWREFWKRRIEPLPQPKWETTTIRPWETTTIRPWEITWGNGSGTVWKSDIYPFSLTYNSKIERIEL